MQTECSPALFEFEAVDGKKIVAGFDGGTITSDAGVLLLGQLDRGLGLIRRMAACFTDRRDPRLVEHRVETLVELPQKQDPRNRGNHPSEICK